MSTSPPVPAARAPLLYLAALGLVALAMAVLPCLYIALTALTGWGTYLFATRYFLDIWAWPGSSAGGAFFVKVLCACTPVLTGTTVALFMVKPLFARRVARMQPLALDPQAEPRVFALVQEVCRIVGAPAPRRVELSCDLNASAHLEPGVRGFFSRRLILTLGLPLVAGLTQRELAGVMAHEFGHFRQGGGIRLSYLIRSINHWFARVIYVRDGWDAFIARWSACATFWWMSLMVLWVRAGVRFARGVLWLLMMAGHLVSAALMRQMEYDADRGQIALAGSAALESALVKFSVLGAAMMEVHLDLRRTWGARVRLPDNLPGLVEYRAQRMPGERRAILENQVGLGRTGLLDTHPCAADRVRRARKLARTGGEISDAPARELFESFDALSRLVTLAHYQDDLKVPVTPGYLLPLEQIIRAETERAVAVETSPAEPPAAESPAAARPRVPMMTYDPSRFQGRARP